MKTFRLTLCCFALVCLSAMPVAVAQDDTAQLVDTVTNPAVRSVLESKRETPADYARAVFVLVDLGEAKRAKPIFDELVALGLDDDARATLVTQFGSARFLRLTRAAELGEAAKTFASECLAAANAAATDPARMDELLADLQADSPQKQAAAIAELKRTGIAGVDYCLAKFAAAEDKQRNKLREALVALKPLSEPALVAMLGSSDADLRKQAAWALGQQRNYRATPLLAAQAVLEKQGSDAGRAAQWAFKALTGQSASSALATRLLRDALRDARGGVPPQTPDADGMVAVYQRDAKLPVATESILMPATDAGVVYAARLARALVAVNPADRQARQTALVYDLQTRSLFESTAVKFPSTKGLDPVQATNETLNGALTLALEEQLAGAAAALCVTLGDRGDASVLITADSKPSPLAAALESPHPAVRFAALRGVMGLKSPTPFPGSSRVADALVDFVSAGQSRVAVVAMPNLDRSTTLGGYLASMGIESRPTNLGAEAAKLAQSGDVEMVFVDLAILRPNVRETIFRLRRATNTGLAPIAILAPAGRLAEAKAVAADHEGVVAFPRPHNADAVTAMVDALANELPEGWPTTAERAELAGVARGWIAETLAGESSGDGPTYYNLRSRAGDVQEALVSGGGAAADLAILGTPASQIELLAIASRRTEPLDVRKATAEAFAKSVERFGVLLTTDQIEQQYDRYNASESADADTQAVLGSLLDAIESKRKAQREAATPSPK